MKTTEINNSIIGKRVKGMFTGLEVTGTINCIIKSHDPHTHELCAIGVEIKLDKNVTWGDCTYDKYISDARVHDEFGNLEYTHLI